MLFLFLVRRMSLIVLSAGIALFPGVSPVLADNLDPPETATAKSDIGPWAIQFGIGSKFSLRPFSEATIALQRDVSEKSALRLGLEYSSRLDWIDGESSIFFYQDTAITRYDLDYSVNRLSLSMAYLRRSSGNADFRAVYGAGPFVRFRLRDNSYADSQNRIGSTISRSQSRRDFWNIWNIGTNAFVGVEWRVFSRASFYAECMASFDYSWNRSEYETVFSSSYLESEYSQKANGNSFMIRSGPVSLGISIIL